MKSPAQRFCFLTILLIAFAGCLLSCEKPVQNSSDSVSNTKISEANSNQFNIAEFERNKNLWSSQNIQNYKIIIGASGFITNFPEEVLIEVRNREAKSIKSLSKTDRNYTDAYKKFDTIEKIFDFVENNQKGYKLDVTFDKTFGYPSKINYDEQSDIADDELRLEVKSLEIANLDKTELKRNKDLWENRKIQNYKMIVTTYGFMMHFGDPVEVEIESAKVKSAKFLTPSEHSLIGLYDDYNTVEKLFSFLDYELSRKPDVLRVSFDAKFGYPIQITLDERIGMSDDEFSVNVKNLEITNKG